MRRCSQPFSVQTTATTTNWSRDKTLTLQLGTGHTHTRQVHTHTQTGTHIQLTLENRRRSRWKACFVPGVLLATDLLASLLFNLNLLELLVVFGRQVNELVLLVPIRIIPSFPAAVPFPRLAVMNGLMGAAPHSASAAGMSKGAGGFRAGSADGHAPASAPDHTHGQALANQSSAGEGDQDVLSTAQRSMLKWEKEEALGEMATVAPVLYCNTNFPQLREQYPGTHTFHLQRSLLSFWLKGSILLTRRGPFPEWSTRVKQIAKLWRKACSQDRAPFVVSFLLRLLSPKVVWKGHGPCSVAVRDRQRSSCTNIPVCSLAAKSSRQSGSSAHQQGPALRRSRQTPAGRTSATSCSL